MSLEELGKISLEVAKEHVKDLDENAVSVTVHIWRGEVIRIALLYPETEHVLQQKHFEKLE